MYLDSLVVTREGSNGTKVHIAEGLQKRYLALVSYLLGDDAAGVSFRALGTRQIECQLVVLV